MFNLIDKVCWLSTCWWDKCWGFGCGCDIEMGLLNSIWNLFLEWDFYADFDSNSIAIWLELLYYLRGDFLVGIIDDGDCCCGCWLWFNPIVILEVVLLLIAL